MHKPGKKNKSLSGAGGAVSAAFFVLVAAVLWQGIGALAQSAEKEGVNATRRAIERASILCYASEGFYPPSLAYIEEHYGVQINYGRYAVRYEISAANIRPNIRVQER